MKKSFIPVLFLALLVPACGRAPAVQDKLDKEAAPLTVSLIPESPRAGDTLRAVVTGADAVSFRWERNGEAVDNASDSLGTSGFRKGEKVGVAVSSGGREAFAESILINSAPVVRSVNLSPSQFSKSTGVNAAPDGYDNDGDSIGYAYEWSVNGERVFEEDGATLDGRHFKRGDTISLRIVPSDREGNGSAFMVDAGKAQNAKPVFASVPPGDFSGVFLYTPKASDPDGDEVKITAAKGPEGMKMEGGRIEWDSKGQKGSFEIVLSADDGNGGEALQRFELKVNDEK